MNSRTRSWAAVIIHWEWLWLAILLPVMILARPGWSPVLLLIPLLWIVRWAAHGRFIPRTPFNIPLLLLLLMVFVSELVTFDLAFSYSKIANLLFGVALFFGVTAFITRPGGANQQRLWWAVAALLGLGWGLGLVSLLGTQWKSTIPLFAPLIDRLPPPLLELPGAADGFSPNQLAGVLPWLLFPALALSGAAWLQPGRWREGIRPFPSTLSRLFITASAGLFLLLLLLTQSRSGYLGFAIGFLFFLLAPLQKRAPRASLLLLGCGLLLLIITTTVFGPTAVLESVVAPVGVESEDFTSGAASLSGRVEIWSRALYGLHDFPLTGMGMNNFRRLAPLLYPLFLFPLDYDIAHAHNHLLQAGLDLGLPGLIAYLAIWGLAAALLRQVWRRGVLLEQALALGSAAGLLAHFVYGITDVVALGSRPGFLFWFLLGLITGLWQISCVREP